MADELTTTQPLEVNPAVKSAVQKWCKRIKDAKEFWAKDFERMRYNMEFAAGYQWAGQVTLHEEDRYTSNVVTRMVNQKVANLYARNPTVKASRRPRMDYVMWDGRMESIMQAAELTMSPEADPADMIAAKALLADYAHGRQSRDMLNKVGETLSNLFMWNLDNQQPSFKVQMKQLARRVVTTSVGYVRMNFSRMGQETCLSTTLFESTAHDRAKRATAILRRVQAGEIDKDSAEVAELSSLLDADDFSEAMDVQEKLVFDFPESTSIIPDPACRALKGFIRAKWLVQEHLMRLEDAEAYFEKKLNTEGLMCYDQSGMVYQPNVMLEDPTRYLCVWEVFDRVTKTTFFVCEGQDDYLLAPEPLAPTTKQFWPIFALTFNDIEVEPAKQKSTIFPPSDVDLLRSAQKERNRTRESLRLHRKANEPKYMTGAGWLTDEDKEAIQSAAPNEIIEIKGAQPGQKIGDLLAPFVHAPVDPLVYDTAPLDADMFAAFGNEENTAPASSKSTATAATINEQSRIVVTTSNVDDLDDFLSNLAEAGGEILLREVSEETVKRIVGAGAVWPTMSVEDFVNSIFLNVVAASSGRPNKALELANFQQIAPILQAAGVNPEFIAREAIKRLDDTLDLDEAFSSPAHLIQAMPLAGAQQSQGKPAQPARGTAAPSSSGQMPAGSVPKERIERPQLSK